MMKIEIIPAPTLLKIADKVEFGDLSELSKIRRLVKDMITTMRFHRGLGLAAPQVGVSKRIIVWTDCSQQKGRGSNYVLINPKIVSSRGKIKFDEACLSVPNIKRKMKRKRVIEVIAFSETGKEKYWKLENMDAIIVQHEIDHLNGLTILSSRKERRARNEEKLRH